MKSKTFMVLIFLSLFWGCKKESMLEKHSSDEIVNNQILKGTYVSTTVPNWEQDNDIQYVRPDNVVERFDYPWILGGIGSFIDIEWINDYYKVDGWELIYNTFDRRVQHPIFALYNRNLGLMRIFYYARYNIGSNGNQIFFGLKVEGNSNLLNFEQKDALAIDKQLTEPVCIKSGQINFANINVAGYAPGNWYGVEYELSYDPGVTNKFDNNHHFLFYIWKSEISEINLTGTQIGDIKGTITYNTTSGSLINTLSLGLNGIGSITNSNSIVNNVAKGLESSKTDNPGFFSRIWSAMIKGVPQGAQSGVKSVVENLVKSGLNWATGPLSGFFGSILGRNTASKEGKVNLKMQTKISLGGTISTSGSVTPVRLIIPKTKLSGNGGSLPAYSNRLGVWTIHKTPVVDYHATTTITNGERSSLVTDHSFHLNTQFNVVLNDDIKSKYVIEGLSKKLIVPEGGVPEVKYYQPFAVVQQENSNNQMYNVYQYDCGTHFGFTNQRMGYHPISNTIRIHVAFTLREIATGEKYYFGKTFLPEIIKHPIQTVYINTPGRPPGR